MLANNTHASKPPKRFQFLTKNFRNIVQVALMSHCKVTVIALLTYCLLLVSVHFVSETQILYFLKRNYSRQSSREGLQRDWHNLQAN